MDNNRTPSRIVEYWTTIAVEALPTGWRNVYEDDGVQVPTPCPALLMQELRTTTHAWDHKRDDGTYELRTRDTHHELPYEVRVVFADHDGATLTPADDVGNYVKTIGPGED